MRTFNGLLLTLLLAAWPLPHCEAKSYSSGGHSYSSHSTSHSSRSGSSSSHSSSRGSSGGSSASRSSSRPSSSGSRPSSSPASSASKSSGSGSTATRSSSSDHSSTKTYHSSSGKSYSSGSTLNDDSRRSYTSGKSYSSPVSPSDPPKVGGRSSGSTPSDGERAGVRGSSQPPQHTPGSASSAFNLDTAAARARKEEASQKEFTRFKESQAPKPPDAEPVPSYAVKPPPIPQRRVYIPDTEVLVTRPVRRHTVFYPYESRPVIIYRDSYSSLFWWWLMDRSLDDRAHWAYHHRYDMDPDRYQALMAENRELENRVQQLETQQVARDPNYVPPGLDRDLMYSERSVQHAYSNRPTTSGRIAFGILAIPALIGLLCFFIWFIFIKRWQPST